MPLNLGNDGDGSSRIILTEPRGSTAEVSSCFLYFISFHHFPLFGWGVLNFTQRF